MEGAGARVDRVEREMDYIETKNPPKPCVKAADKMVEQEVVVRERKKEEFFELSGKSGELSFDSWSWTFDLVLSGLALLALFKFSMLLHSRSFGGKVWSFLRKIVTLENQLIAAMQDREYERWACALI